MQPAWGEYKVLQVVASVSTSDVCRLAVTEAVIISLQPPSRHQDYRLGGLYVQDLRLHHPKKAHRRINITKSPNNKATVSPAPQAPMANVGVAKKQTRASSRVDRKADSML